jgi:hypothetical protein
LTAPSDSSSADTAAGFRYAFDCGLGWTEAGTASTATCATSDTGTLFVRAAIRDKDGGVTEYDATVQVVVTYESLCALVRSLTANVKVADALCAKLGAAASATARGNDTARRNELASFDMQLDAQTDKTISAQDAELLHRLSARLAEM